ncbi:carboxymethylenebutenolidase [Hoeflea marina]|uniref:Carboxymethylenebutenolidase n=1 Tax=Hoeflea marina TaxID=274592 RepID=A0A317PIY3_9HYPH|nr:dienelactone hydrolase family protein [Hoeflea marina]PWV99167.1 carboxymethylenebutenolidase [Hoeflea marina]
MTDRSSSDHPAMPEITQQMIKAYDDYTHLTLDRRRFMEELTRLAGSGAAAAAIAPMLAASQAQAALVEDGDPRISASEASFPAPGGEMQAYLVRPADASGPLPAVLVIHENRGLNEHTRDIARRLALEGFMTLAVDFLSPVGGTPADEDKAREMIGQLDGARTTANAVAAARWMADRPDASGAVGAVGFCWGGGLVNQLAVHDPDLDAGVAYYGRQAEADDAAKIQAALLLHYAGLDERINAGIEAYRSALEAAGKDVTIHVYDGVNHAFNNDTSAARYNKPAADLAWSRTVEFLKAKLG